MTDPIHASARLAPALLLAAGLALGLTRAARTTGLRNP